MDVILESMKKSIDKMNKIQHVEILKLFKDHNVKLNENKNGTYINISFLSSDVIEELQKYVLYIEEQEKSLEVIEIKKRELSLEIIESKKRNLSLEVIESKKRELASIMI
jgi:hypothetical protein